MSKKFLRRRFLQGTAAAAHFSLRGASCSNNPYSPAQRKSPAPSDRLRMGIIGVGMQGSGLVGKRDSAARCRLYCGRRSLR